MDLSVIRLHVGRGRRAPNYLWDGIVAVAGMGGSNGGGGGAMGSTTPLKGSETMIWTFQVQTMNNFNIVSMVLHGKNRLLSTVSTDPSQNVIWPFTTGILIWPLQNTPLVPPLVAGNDVLEPCIRRATQTAQIRLTEPQSLADPADRQRFFDRFFGGGGGCYVLVKGTNLPPF